MSEHKSDRIQDLQQVVAQLGATLAVSERRTRRLERTIRWGAIGAFAVFGLTISFSFNILGNAFAQPDADNLQNSPSNVVEALNSINANLGGLGMMTQMMQVSIEGAIQRAWDEQNNNHKLMNELGESYDPKVVGSPLGTYVEKYTTQQCKKIKEMAADASEVQPGQPQGTDMMEFCNWYNNKLLPKMPLTEDSEFSISEDQRKEFMALVWEMYQGAIMTATGNVMVDTGVLMYRVRQDSDYFRGLVHNIGGPNKMLEGIRNELRALNGMMQAVPVMATRMDAMTAQMGVMSHSVGSTMGRAGSWMPW